MNTRDRLTELIKKQVGHTLPSFISSETINILVDYLLENGVIVIPCKIGNTLYCDGKYFASYCEGEIHEFKVQSIITKVESYFRGEIEYSFEFEDFGKAVFLTRKQAEKALKRKRTK